MSKFFSLLLIFFILISAVLNTAEAARFGGGRSFGAQRSISSFSRSQPTAGAFQRNVSGNRFFAPLLGLAAGGLLAYLFMGHGLGASLLSWLAIFGVGLMAWNFLRTKLQPQTQSAQARPYNENNVYNAQTAFAKNDTFSGTRNAAPYYPAGFDSTTFLRDAKVQFIRLQAANDAKDLNDLRQFTSPEVFAEIQLQLQERGPEENKTEVLTLNAELLDVVSPLQTTEASVKFSGLIKEIPNEPAQPFEEIWHFRKDDNKENWLVTGVQQV